MELFYIIIPVIILCWYYWIYKKYVAFGAALYTPIPVIPIIGHTYIVFRGAKWVASWSGDILSRKGIKETCDTICLWLPTPKVIIYGKEDIRKVLSRSCALDKPKAMQMTDWVVRGGLVTASADVWKFKRRFMNPLFQSTNVDQLMPTFNSNCRDLVATMSGKVGCGPVDVFPLTLATAIQSICGIIFGPELKYDVNSEEMKNLVYSVKRTTELAIERESLVWLWSDVVFRLLYWREIKSIKDYFHGFLNKRLQELEDINNRRQMKYDKEAAGYDSTNGDQPAETEMINLPGVYNELLSKHPTGFPGNNLSGDAVTFFLAGSDTVATTISTCFVMLAKFKDLQDRLYNEVESTVGLDGDINIQDLSRMPYLDQVYKESLRWSCTVPMILRKSTEDMHLSSCTIPAGQAIVVSLGGLGMDPKTFPNPDRFDPDRFLPENRKDADRFDFLPFSGGPRNCIGKRYSDLFVKTMIAYVVRNFTLSTTMDPYTMKRKMAITLISVDGYNVSLERRV